MSSSTPSAGSPIIPTLRYRDAHAAIAWLQNAFGFKIKALYEGANNTVAHAELTLGSGMIMLGSVTNQGPGVNLSIHPDEIGGRSTKTIYLVVPDASAAHTKACEAGADITSQLAEMSYGGKAFACRDLEGHDWSLGEYNPWAHPPASP